MTIDVALIHRIFDHGEVLDVSGTELEQHVGADEVIVALGKRLFIVKVREVN